MTSWPSINLCTWWKGSKNRKLVTTSIKGEEYRELFGGVRGTSFNSRKEKVFCIQLSLAMDILRQPQATKSLGNARWIKFINAKTECLCLKGYAVYLMESQGVLVTKNGLINGWRQKILIFILQESIYYLEDGEKLPLCLKEGWKLISNEYWKCIWLFLFKRFYDSLLGMLVKEITRKKWRSGTRRCTHILKVFLNIKRRRIALHKYMSLGMLLNTICWCITFNLMWCSLYGDLKPFYLQLKFRK